MTTPAEIGETLRLMIEDEIKKRPSEIEQRIIANRVKLAIEAWIKAGQTPPEPV